MVKKKVTEAEEKKEKERSETTDNKDNIQAETGTGDGLTSPSEEMVETEETPVTETAAEQVADKAIPEEKNFEVKLAEMQDRYLRLSAEFDNYRKRTLKEKMEIAKYAGEDILMSILPFMDDFERALKHIEDSPECKPIKDGIDLIYSKFSDFLAQQGLKEIDTLNCEFNVDLHDAVAQTPVAEPEKKGKIVDVVLKGYYLKDKVIRHSKVVIGE